MITFKTKQEALDAGYELPKKVKGVRDTSGVGAFGYDFTEYDEAGNELRSTVTVWLTEERNKGGRLGAFLPMFPPRS